MTEKTIPFPDPKVPLRQVVLVVKGMLPVGKYARVVNFPTVIRDDETLRRRFRNLINEGDGPKIRMTDLSRKDHNGNYSGAYLGVYCRWRMDKGEIGYPGEFIHDPMLAYLVDLLHYGFTEMESWRKMKEGREWNPPEPIFPAGFSAPAPNKYVKDAVKVTENCISWPTFSVGPRGYQETRAPFRRLKNGPKPLNNAVLNAYLATIQFGAGSLKNYDNPIPVFRPDDSQERIVTIQHALGEADLRVVEDTGWKGASFNSCITDYKRVVQFNRDPEKQELELFRELLQLDQCPGWTGVRIQRQSPNDPPQEGWTVFQFTTTMDSSG